ncbi:anaerobic sulfite reductase subunit AsrA [Stomatobaculum sp. F0698]|jgi:sulfite reductase, subunit A|uniref:anaerobic sulfite reductase subunit AsrA n=1 Tax=Stomatobaculum sp. F0698 TaxID=3059030 RepID=UPI00272B81FD|nr:anaerobic sulfite reductase subunit AsrA [Stomatobaculum sp. F0698]WLD87259.1 anaerobic sulfite reductase subunit AsrA [Stomatobaculum sp. F0698]
MGYILTEEGFQAALKELRKEYRLFAPVRKKGAGRFLDIDTVIYDEVGEGGEIELEAKSDYSAKEALTPLSETLFFFTEEQCKEADVDLRPALVFLRSCDLQAMKRLDQMYLGNGRENDWFYQRRREKIQYVLIGCSHSFDNCFCVDMKSNITKDGYVFSVDKADGQYRVNVLETAVDPVFAAAALSEEAVEPCHVTENEVRVRVPENIPLEIVNHPLWDEYNTRCIGCGRCNYACPTCSCYTMQDVFYTDNGKVGERRRVGSSCMVDGYSNVAGGGQYRKKQGERMRFKVLHKIRDYRKRFGYDMCVGCGRCDDICGEYISFSNIINKVAAAVEEMEKEDSKNA